MGRVKLLAFAYRKWALNALLRIMELRCESAEIYVYSKKDAPTVELFEKIDPNLTLFYGWSWIVPEEVIDRWLCICLHPSSLPKYRGGSPIQHQIIAGEKIGAVSFFRMTKELDAGPLCAQVPLSLEGILQDVLDRTSRIAVSKTLDFIDTLSKGQELIFSEQKGKPTVYKRRKPVESEITRLELDTLSAERLHDKIRALSIDTEDYPAAFIACAGGKKLCLTGSRVEV